MTLPLPHSQWNFAINQFAEARPVSSWSGVDQPLTADAEFTGLTNPTPLEVIEADISGLPSLSSVQSLPSSDSAAGTQIPSLASHSGWGYESSYVRLDSNGLTGSLWDDLDGHSLALDLQNLLATEQIFQETSFNIHQTRPVAVHALSSNAIDTRPSAAIDWEFPVELLTGPRDVNHISSSGNSTSFTAHCATGEAIPPSLAPIQLGCDPQPSTGRGLRPIASKNPQAAASNSASGTILKPRRSTQRVRGKLTDEQRDKAKKMRKIGNCLRCKQYKLGVSSLFASNLCYREGVDTILV